MVERSDRMRMWRSKGSPAEVEDLRAKWRHLHELDCGHSYECPEFLERNQAVAEASEQVSVFQEQRVFRSLGADYAHRANSPLDGMFSRMSQAFRARRGGGG